MKDAHRIVGNLYVTDLRMRARTLARGQLDGCRGSSFEYDDPEIKDEVANRLAKMILELLGES